MANARHTRCIDVNSQLNELKEQVNDLETVGEATAITIKEEGAVVGAALSFTILNFVGANLTATDAGGGQANVTFVSTAGSQNVFDRVAVAGQDTVIADSTTDTLTLVAGSNITLSTTAVSDSIEIAAAGESDGFATVTVSGQTTYSATTPTSAIPLAAGTGISITTNGGVGPITITNTGGGGGGGGGNRVRGTLDSDLQSSDATATVNVVSYQGSNPGATIVANNPPTTLTDDDYLFVGNEGGVCIASEWDDGWYLDLVELPVAKPEEN